MTPRRKSQVRKQWVNDIITICPIYSPYQLDITCFIHILQCSATDSPILAITRLLLMELSSNLGSTFLAAATGSWCWCATDLLSREAREGEAEDNTADVWLVMELLGPIMGSIRPEISHFLYFVSRDFIQHQHSAVQ